MKHMTTPGTGAPKSNNDKENKLEIFKKVSEEISFFESEFPFSKFIVVHKNQSQQAFAVERNKEQNNKLPTHGNFVGVPFNGEGKDKKKNQQIEDFFDNIVKLGGFDKLSEEERRAGLGMTTVGKYLIKE